MLYVLLGLSLAFNLFVIVLGVVALNMYKQKKREMSDINSVFSNLFSNDEKDKKIIDLKKEFGEDNINDKESFEDFFNN